MKAGEVVTIRVNPRDCMGVVDVVNKLGATTQGMSFSAAVAIALSSMLEALREHEIIPAREGFEFSELMRPFTVKSRTGRKLAISKTLMDMAYKYQVPAVVNKDPEHAKRRRRLEELRIKLQGDELNFSEAEHEELRVLTIEFDGLPT